MVRETLYVREPRYAERYRDQRFSRHTGPRTHAREVAALTRLLQRSGVTGGTWLDVPSGAGRLSALLPGHVVRADRDPAMLAACSDETPRVCGSAVALPFDDGVFDGALCMRLIQHIPGAVERVAILAELRRVTAGPVVVSFFDAISLQHARRVLARCLGKPRSGRVALRPARFRAELRRAGLQVVAEVPLCRFVSEQRLVMARRIQ